MNLKLAKKIRQGMREMAQVKTGGAMSAKFPEEYEVIIRKSINQKNAEGEDVVIPTAIQIILQKIAPRYIYKRTKRMVLSI
jgi:hypothetical protein